MIVSSIFHQGSPALSCQNFSQMFHNPLRGLPVPQRRDRAFLPLPCQQSRERGGKLARISPNQFVGADGDGFQAFGVVAQGNRDTLCLETYSALRP
jgi:hypothetical protein